MSELLKNSKSYTGITRTVLRIFTNKLTHKRLKQAIATFPGCTNFANKPERALIGQNSHAIGRPIKKGWLNTVKRSEGQK